MTVVGSSTEAADRRSAEGDGGDRFLVVGVQ
jgi:hypothetical protein